MLSVINWTNRNVTSGPNDNRFDDVFGGLAAQAIGVVDAAISTWARTINNFNYSNGTNTYNVIISMNASASNTGANAGTTANIGNKPSAATVGIGWNNTPANGNSAAGWWLDPTPYDSSEFTFELNAFVSQNTGSLVGADLFTTVAHELGHAMGLGSGAALNALSSDTNQNDTLNVPASNPVSTYWQFNGPSVRSLWTEWDSGGATGAANNAMGVQHFAPNGARFPSVNPTHFGAVALMNAAGTPRSRATISNVEALMLQDAYSYTITLPTTYQRRRR